MRAFQAHPSSIHTTRPAQSHHAFFTYKHSSIAPHTRQLIVARQSASPEPEGNATSVSVTQQPATSAEQNSTPAPRHAPSTPLPAVQPPSFVKSIYKSLQDFGVGKKSMLEGGVGLFVLMGSVAAVALISWARGNALRTGHPYLTTIEFPLASGITVGTPVRIRGVQIGTVLNVKPSLDKVEVLVEVADQNTVIPRNSIIEANQSGLIAEPLVDITPQLPIPEYKALPLDPSCSKEGLVVCHNEHIQGRQGVALDDLVYIMTRLARQAEADGVDKIFAAAEAATKTIEEARPLLAEAGKLLEEVTPLLAELRASGLVNNVEALTKTAADAAADIQKLQGAILTDDNVKALRQSVLTLCKTLEHVESISSDISVLARDQSVQRNLKTLVQALSRLVDE